MTVAHNLRMTGAAIASPPAPVYRLFVAFSRDAALLLLRAIRVRPRKEKGVLAIARLALIRQLGEMSGFDGVTGTIRFDSGRKPSTLRPGHVRSGRSFG